MHTSTQTAGETAQTSAFSSREFATASLVLLGEQHYQNVRNLFPTGQDAPEGCGADIGFAALCILLSSVEVNLPEIPAPADTNDNRARILIYCRKERTRLSSEVTAGELVKRQLSSGVPIFSMLNITRLSRQVIEAVAFYRQHATTFAIVPDFASALFTVITGRSGSESEEAKFRTSLFAAADRAGVSEPEGSIFTTDSRLEYDQLAESILIAAHRC